MTKRRELRYGGAIPTDYLPAHNQVIHTPEFVHGENGFRRFWIPPEDVPGKWSECPCGWRDRGNKKWNEGGPHYAVTGHAEWWREQTEQRGGLEAVYRHVRERLEHGDD